MPSHDDEGRKRSSSLLEGVRDVKLEPSPSPVKDGSLRSRDGAAELPPRNGATSSIMNGTASPLKRSPKKPSQSPVKVLSTPHSPTAKAEQEEIVGGDITVKVEPGEPPKLARTASKKIMSKPPTLFLDAPDATPEAKKTFEHIVNCTYANKYLGTTDHAMECECSEEWDAATQTNRACGEDSDCINRATKMECVGDCNCGADCQNQRFQRREYAAVSVIKTEKKGYGLRTDMDLLPNTFIYEYIGEVIGEAAFRRRMAQYDEEGIKHFYFMSLNKGEFVDATRRGNLGRFCNHSCNPNCYVDKWVVGDKLRMGIFAERKISAGEELVFNYNVDRYGANPQPCYCGEQNCTGFIGGKTQTERGTKLPAATIEALGIDDADDWDLAVSKKWRKKKPGEDDEEYVDRIQPKSLNESAVVQVMATLMQCKEKWITVKLLNRIQRCEEERVRSRVVKMHGYRILNSQLSMWIDDDNIALQMLDILNKLPRITRNKIQDSKIEDTVEKLLTSGNDLIRDEAAKILKIWRSLEMGYRIPRHTRDPAAAEREREEQRRAIRDRSKSPSRSRSVSPDVPKGPSAPSGPRAGTGPHNRNFFPPRPQFRRPFNQALPAGWFQAQSNGQTYYYSASGQTTWQRPTLPATQPPPPPKIVTNEQKLQDIINSITAVPKDKPETVPEPEPEHKSPTNHEREKPKEKWRSYDEEKKKKLYENTLFPHVKYVMDKFKGKLPKEDLKRFAKEVSKKLVASDFKNNRVEDPTKITSKQEKNVRKYVKDYFEKAVAKKSEHDKKKAEKERHAKRSSTAASPPEKTDAAVHSPEMNMDPPASSQNEEITFSENEAEDDGDGEEPSPSTQDDAVDADLKRKREADETPLTTISPGDDTPTPSKRIRSESETPQIPPPPPPPPPPLSELTGLPDASEVANHFADASLINTATAGDHHQVNGDTANETFAAMNTIQPDRPKESARPFAQENPGDLEQQTLEPTTLNEDAEQKPS